MLWDPNHVYYTPEDKRLEPQIHPIEIRKIIWTKPSFSGSMRSSSGVYSLFDPSTSSPTQNLKGSKTKRKIINFYLGEFDSFHCSKSLTSWTHFRGEFHYTCHKHLPVTVTNKDLQGFPTKNLVILEKGDCYWVGGRSKSYASSSFTKINRYNPSNGIWRDFPNLKLPSKPFWQLFQTPWHFIRSPDWHHWTFALEKNQT